MGFVYTSVLMYPFSSLDTLTSKKFTVVSLMSAVNLIVSWKAFKASKKKHSSSRECCHIIKMSSIYLHHTIHFMIFLCAHLGGWQTVLFLKTLYWRCSHSQNVCFISGDKKSED